MAKTFLSQRTLGNRSRGAQIYQKAAEAEEAQPRGPLPEAAREAVLSLPLPLLYREPFLQNQLGTLETQQHIQEDGGRAEPAADSGQDLSPVQVLRPAHEKRALRQPRAAKQEGPAVVCTGLPGEAAALGLRSGDYGEVCG